jgi:YgiT-type zinc finger domain-containing protein
MNCLICKEGLYEIGVVTVMLSRGEASVIIKGVPARVCDLCGEYILDDETTKAVLVMANAAFASGAEVEIRRFAA